MNKICKEYVGEIKTLFPIKKKQEKAYIKKLALDVSGYCFDANITTKQDLYDNYGKPFDVVSNYVSTVDTTYIVKNLRIAKFIRRAIAVILVLATIVTVVHSIYLHHLHQLFEYNKIVEIESEIVDNGIIEHGIIEEEFIEKIIE